MGRWPALCPAICQAMVALLTYGRPQARFWAVVFSAARDGTAIKTAAPRQAGNRIIEIRRIMQQAPHPSRGQKQGDSRRASVAHGTQSASAAAAIPADRATRND